MAEDTETQNDLPAGEATLSPTTQTPQLTTLKGYGVGLAKQAFEAVNATAAPKARSQATTTLPQLVESVQTGYKKGKEAQVICCYVGKHLVEKNTAYDFLMMRNVAAAAGISLSIRDAFRDNDTQTRLYNERLNPAVRKEKGAAARPKFSNHQMGNALDLDVGMRKAQYILNDKSPTYLWLEKHAAAYGFDHVEGHSVNEPWHWTHLEARVVGVAAYQNATNLIVQTTDTALAAASTNQSGGLRLVNREAHDETVVWARSEAFSQATRQGMMSTERATASAFASNYVTNKVGQLESAWNTLEDELQPFDANTLTLFVYNFETGTWGDGKTV